MQNLLHCTTTGKCKSAAVFERHRRGRVQRFVTRRNGQMGKTGLTAGLSHQRTIAGRPVTNPLQRNSPHQSRNWSGGYRLWLPQKRYESSALHRPADQGIPCTIVPSVYYDW